MSEENKKPPYDEQALAKLLEAAYVLQEHSDELRALELQLGLTRSQEQRARNTPDLEARPDQNPAPQELCRRHLSEVFAYGRHRN